MQDELKTQKELEKATSAFKRNDSVQLFQQYVNNCENNDDGNHSSIIISTVYTETKK